MNHSPDNNHRLKAALDHSMDGIAMLDASGIYYYLNHEHIVMFGYEKEEELLGKNWQFIYGEKEIERINTSIFPILTEKKQWRGETLGKSKTGEPVPQEISLTLLENGEIICICRNIARQKKEIQQLELNREIMEKTNSMIIVTNPAGEIEWVNRSFCQVTGYNLDEIKGIKPGKLLQGKDSDQKEIARIREAIRKKEPFYAELLNYKKDGTPYWIEIKGQPLFNSKGEVEHFFAIEEDITDRKENQLKLEESNLRLELALKGISAATWELNLETGEVYYSDYLYKMTGYAEGEIKNLFKENSHFMHEDDREKTFAVFAAFITNKHDHIECEFRVRHKLGYYIWILMRAVVSERRISGQPEKIIGILIDISNIKQTQIQLEKARDIAESSVKAKRRFLANVSHEIRTPMHAIMGLSEQLSLSDLKPEQSVLIQIIHDSSKALMNIINDVLDLSKIEEGKFMLDELVFDPNQLIRQTYSLFAPQALKKAIAFELHQSQEEKDVFLGDASRIRQVYSNIINNAIKFTEHGRIDIDFRIEKTGTDQISLIFICKDTGVGMSEEMKKRIFEEFVQEDESFHRKYGGSGLGLSITNELVKLMKGDIQIESKKNAGTTITVKIPVRAITDKTHKNSDDLTPINLHALQRVRILAAEDNEFNRLLMKFIFEKNKIPYDFAENGKVAVELASAKTYDIILMDIQMPEMDGLEATQLLRKHFGSNIPIIAITANAIKEELDYYLKQGFTDYLTKPFEEKKLLQKLSRLIR